MDRLFGRIIMMFLPPHWSEAVLSEAEHVEPGWPRTRWLAGGAVAAVKEGFMSLRFGAWLGIAGAAGVAAYTIWRYPIAAGGGGGPLYLSLLALLLLGYATAAWWVTRGGWGAAGVRRGTQFGAAAAAVAGVAAMPYGLGVWRGAVILIAFLGVPFLLAFAAIKAMRDGGSPVQALVAGGWGGGMAALAAFIWGIAMSAAAPERLAIDSDVAARHTGADLIAANLGEQSVIYILGLVAGPVLGLLAGVIGNVIVSSRSVQRNVT